MFNNRITQQVLEIDARLGDANFSDIQLLVSGIQDRVNALEHRNVNYGIICTGMVVGSIDDIRTCEGLIRRMAAEAREYVKLRLQALSQEQPEYIVGIDRCTATVLGSQASILNPKSEAREPDFDRESEKAEACCPRSKGAACLSSESIKGQRNNVGE